MSAEQDKIKHSRRKLQKENHINRQIAIRQSHSFGDGGTPAIPKTESAHRYHKKSGMTCGDSNCVMCGNPRKFFGDVTLQEKRLTQDVDTVRSRHSNGIFPTDIE